VNAPTSPVTPDDVAAAHERIAPYVRRTPVLALTPDDVAGLPAPVLLKLELLQHAGSFKPRGAFHRVLRERDAGTVPPAGVIAASGGNHGAALALVAQRLGIAAEIFVPASSPPLKAERIRSYGATVVVGGDLYDDAQAAADRRAAETGALQVHPYDHVATVAGAGTCARELDEQAGGRIDTVLTSTGGGGLTAGTAAWFAGRARVVSVEPDTSRCLAAALDAGEPVTVPVSGLAADSLGARRVGAVTFAVARANGVVGVTVDDDAIRDAQRALWRALRLVAEPGGAAALAALLSGAYRPAAGERVAVVVCGANCDPATVADGVR
jgi:threonine dehydratase